ncbi:MAG: hypothetical protein Q4A41_06210 [Bacillota bacterium]|nr:hypothetical protein [Bacillota bacterium]
MSGKRVFPIVFFSVLIALLDFAVYTLLGEFAAYNVAISLFVTNIIYMFLAVKIGSNGVVIANVVFRALLYLLISPYPAAYLISALCGAALGELILFFVKRKRAFLPNAIIYFVFHLVYAMRDYIVLDGGIAFLYDDTLWIALGSVAGSFVLSFVISRLILMPKLRMAGIEK